MLTGGERHSREDFASASNKNRIRNDHNVAIAPFAVAIVPNAVAIVALA